MAHEILEVEALGHLVKAASHLVQLPKSHLWFDYDEQADVLYVHFEEKPRSTHSDMQDDGIILDYHYDKLVGVTILDASHR